MDKSKTKTQVIGEWVGVQTNTLMVIFLVLKIGGVVDWNWWIILSPVFFKAIWIILAMSIVGLVAIANKDK